MPNQYFITPRIADFDLNHLSEPNLMFTILQATALNQGFKLFQETTATNDLQHDPNVIYTCQVGRDSTNYCSIKADNPKNRTLYFDLTEKDRAVYRPLSRILHQAESLSQLYREKY